MNKPFKKLTKKEQDLILYGSDELIRFKYTTKGGIKEIKKIFMKELLII